MGVAAAESGCPHCGSSIVDPLAAPFCCRGCEGAFEFLRAARLDGYYALRQGPGRPVATTAGPDHKWLEPLVAAVRAAAPVARVDLDVQGVHCSACVWLIARLFDRQPGHGSVIVNPAIGRVQLVVGPLFDLAGFVSEVERFGYQLGPARKSEHRASSDLVWRMGVCIAVAMNSMIFAIAMYAGLDDGPLFVLFQRLNIALSLVSVAVGGTVFFRAAWQGLRRGILHLDVPIALGIALAFAGSVYSYAHSRSAASYVDTLDVFIALMLVGRWLRERVLERNRLELLASDGAEGLLTRRRDAGSVSTVRCTSIDVGDVLVLSPGDLVPVDGRLLGDVAESCSLDWINGESRPRAFEPGGVIPAGAFVAGRGVIEVAATTSFEGSPLLDLLRTPVSRDSDGAMQTPWWQRVTRYYVGAVLLLASLGGGGWLLATHDLVRSLGVATAVLIVTCPCAFGLATPLAYDLVQARLRRNGLFVRSAGFLDRAASVRTVVFDKTGTVTEASATVDNPEALEALSAEDRRALEHLVLRSHHPKALAVRAAIAALAGRGAWARTTSPEGDLADASVTEWPGLGVEMTPGGSDGVRYRLGSAAWAGAVDVSGGADLAFARKGVALATLRCSETLRPDAAVEVRALTAEGYDVWLLSGDEPHRVEDVATRCGLPPGRAVGGASPRDKDEWLARHDHRDALMVGDGINDTLAVEHAYCSGTPAIDRPFMAARSDFYFVSPGLAPIRAALHAAKALVRVRSMNLSIALAYNAVAVALSYAGLMSPLVCAVIMPLSSLTTIAATRVALSPRSRLWKP
jgi:Cu2+-exporting ATPase